MRQRREKKQYILGKGHHPASFTSFLSLLSSCTALLAGPLPLPPQQLKTPPHSFSSYPFPSFLSFSSLLTAVLLCLLGPDPYTLLSSVVFFAIFATITLLFREFIKTPRLHHHPVLKPNCRYVERTHRHVYARPGGECLLASPLSPEPDNRAN